MDYLVDLFPLTILQGDPTHSKRLPPTIANQGMQSEVLTEDIIEHSTLEHLGSLEGGGREGGMGGGGKGGGGRGGRKGGRDGRRHKLSY